MHGIPNHTKDAIFIMAKTVYFTNQLVYSSSFVQFHHDISMFDSINPLLWNSCALRMRLLKCRYLLTSRRPMDRMTNHMGYVASSPGPSQILSRSRGKIHGCEIKSGRGLGTRLWAMFINLVLQNKHVYNAERFILHSSPTFCVLHASTPTLQPSISILLYLILTAWWIG